MILPSVSVDPGQVILSLDVGRDKNSSEVSDPADFKRRSSVG